MIMPGVVDNRSELKNSLKWMHYHASHPDCIGAFASHDAGVKPQVIEF